MNMIWFVFLISFLDTELECYYCYEEEATFSPKGQEQGKGRSGGPDLEHCKAIPNSFPQTNVWTKTRVCEDGKCLKRPK
jgi:hypothetical protein